MKNKICISLICVIFLLSISSINTTYALKNEQLEFLYNDKIFTYNLSSNIKSSSVFSLDFESNKYHRFGSKQERQKLLKHLLNLKFDNQVIAEYLFPNIHKTVEKMQKIVETPVHNAKISTNSNTEKVFFIEN